MRRPPTKPSAIPRAFTLIELLVVVSIIALLLSILVPSLNRARQQSRATVCMANMRSLGLAVHAYANANGDCLVTVGLAHGGTVNEHAAWINTLRKEYRNPLVARCPADKSPHWQIPLAGTTTRRRTSFGMNYYTFEKLHGRGPYNRLSMFKRPSGTIYTAELAETGAYAASDHIHAEVWLTDPRRLAGEELALERHVKKANYGFIDAHVDRLAFEQTYVIDEERSNFPNIVWIHNLYDPFIAR